MEYNGWFVAAWTEARDLGFHVRTTNARGRGMYLNRPIQKCLIIVVCIMTCILFMASCECDSLEMTEHHTKTTLPKYTEIGSTRERNTIDLSTCDPYEPGGHHAVTSLLTYYQDRPIWSSCDFGSYAYGVHLEIATEFCKKIRHRLGAVQVLMRKYSTYVIERRNHRSSDNSLSGLIDECLEAEALTARLFADIFFLDADNHTKIMDPWENEPAREEVYPGLFRLQWAGKDKELDTCDDIFAGVELRGRLMDSQWSCIVDSIREVGDSLQLPSEEKIVIDNQAGGTISIHSSGCFTSLSLNKGNFGLPFWSGEISIDRCIQPDDGDPKRSAPEPPTDPPVPGP